MVIQNGSIAFYLPLHAILDLVFSDALLVLTVGGLVFQP